MKTQKMILSLMAFSFMGFTATSSGEPSHTQGMVPARRGVNREAPPPVTRGVKFHVISRFIQQLDPRNDQRLPGGIHRYEWDFSGGIANPVATALAYEVGCKFQIEYGGALDSLDLYQSDEGTLSEVAPPRAERATGPLTKISSGVEYINFLEARFHYSGLRGNILCRRASAVRPRPIDLSEIQEAFGRHVFFQPPREGGI